MAEKQKILYHELEVMKASDEDTRIPGYDRVKIYSGNSIGNTLIPGYDFHEQDYFK